MDVQAMRWFQQVADGATVTEVADIEQVSQPGVSRALARLEREVGAPLLRRSGRHLRMTHAGAVFKRHLDGVLHQLDDGLAAVDAAVQPDTGTVTLGFQTTLGSWLVPELVRTFRRQHPRVRFELTQTPDHLADALLDSGRVDLLISTVPPSGPAVHHRVLLTEPLRLAVPAGHRLAEREAVRLADAAGEPFLLLRPPSTLRRQTERLCQAAGFRPTPAFEGEDVPTLHGFVAAGLGVALLPAGSPAAAGGAGGAGGRGAGGGAGGGASGGRADGADGGRVGGADRADGGAGGAGGDGSAADAGPVRHLRVLDEGATRDVGLSTFAEDALPPAARLFLDHVLSRARTGALPALPSADA
ncbi:LysR family transcriptional regulator [Cellulomonas sp. Y8]|uniref:LysR family transcriptional regulator n=1 Tax=Cellulomonas sp. Y8 TaxID=2591145 RepID=UPI003D764E0D